MLGIGLRGPLTPPTTPPLSAPRRLRASGIHRPESPPPHTAPTGQRPPSHECRSPPPTNTCSCNPCSRIRAAIRSVVPRSTWNVRRSRLFTPINLAPAPKRPFQFRFVMNLDQGGQSRTLSPGHAIPATRVGQNRDNQQHRVRPHSTASSTCRGSSRKSLRNSGSLTSRANLAQILAAILGKTPRRSVRTDMSRPPVRIPRDGTGSKSARITPAEGDAFFTSAINATVPGLDVRNASRKSRRPPPRWPGPPAKRRTSTHRGGNRLISRRFTSTIRSSTFMRRRRPSLRPCV
jgi:hypothetical protein